MRKAINLKAYFFILAIAVSSVNLKAQNDEKQKQGILQMACEVISISPSSITFGSGGGQTDVGVYTVDECDNYRASESLTWISCVISGFTVTITAQPNSGPARSGYVNIGGGFIVDVYQNCNPLPSAGNISGTGSVCAGTTGVNYSVDAIPGATGYAWALPSGASIASGNNTNSITVNFSESAVSGNISVQGIGCNLGSPSPNYYVTVNTISQPGAISGPSSVCEGATFSYSIAPVPDALSYTWTKPSGATGSSTTNSINVTFGSTSGNVSVIANTQCGTSTPSSKAITVNSLFKSSMSGGGATCPGVGKLIQFSSTINYNQYIIYLNGRSDGMFTGNGSTVEVYKSSPGTYTFTGLINGCEIPMIGSAVITNYDLSTDATSVTGPPSPVCPYPNTTLTVNGGSLGANAVWKCYDQGPGVHEIYSGTSRSININPSSTTTYWVKPLGTCGVNSYVSVQVSITTVPVITQHPQTVRICSGAATSFTCSASGNVTYQWQYQDGIYWPNISGATSPTYSIPSTAGMNERVIRCAVSNSNSCFTINSDPATILFYDLTHYAINSASTNICPTQQNEFWLSGSEPDYNVTYKCYLNGNEVTHQPIPGNGGRLTLGYFNAPGVYTAKGFTTKGCEIPMTGSVTLTVKSPSIPPSSITASPTDICPGGNPGGSSVLSFQDGSLENGAGVWHWYSGEDPCGSAVEGSGTTSITVHPNVTTKYYVRAEGGCIPTSCTPVTVNVKPMPAITAHPTNSSVYLGNDASFSVTATGPNLQYQWQVSQNGVDGWTDLTGLPAIGYQTANLIVKTSTNFEDNFYRCKIVSDCNTINSSSAKITLIFPESGYLTGNDIPDPETRVLNTSFPVGSTSGSFNVDPAGGASYTIPIEIPAGVNGLSPSLSIAYSSSGGPGIAGYGWQIGGLSAIGRGPQNFYNDGKYVGVNMDMNDRFYLDGQRLVNTSLNYENAATDYRTENDIFTRITPEDVNYGPSWFKAETKSGLTYEYGKEQASKQKITGFSQSLNWYVSKISDLFGNTINYKYINDHFSIYPSEISYGPNTIIFQYKQRSDKITSFFKGVKIEQWLLLDKIIVKYNSSVVKTYEFKHSYQSSTYNSYSLLNEIVESGTGTSKLNSTAISYKVPTTASIVQTTYNTTHQYVNYNSLLVPGDYNGDGKKDFLCLPDASKGATWSGMRIYFGDGNDNFPTYISSTNSIDLTKLQDIYSNDLNGDGKDDIIYETIDEYYSYFNYMLFDSSLLSSPVQFYSQLANLKMGLFGKVKRAEHQEMDNVISGCDYNGDGVNDIFINDAGGNWYLYSLANSAGNITTSLNLLGSNTASILTNADVNNGDFNGDGKSDIWVFGDNELNIFSIDGNNLILLANYPNVSRKHFFTLGDYNGDGKVDLFLYGYGKGGTEYDWSDWQIRLSTGVTFETHSFTQKKANLKNDYVRGGDFNGDGRSDIMVTSLNNTWNGTYFFICKNNGLDFYTHNIPNYPMATHRYSLGDFNGDGRTDFICTDGEAAWWTGYQLYRDTTSISSIYANKFADGLGALTKVTYQKLSQAPSSVYQHGSGATYPVTDFQGPLLIVSSIQVDNGIGSMNTQNYYYEGAKIHVQGKGFLGYSKTKISDAISNIENETISSYNNQYFYPESVKRITKLIGTTDTISKTSSSNYYYAVDATKKRIIPSIIGSTQTNKLTGQTVSQSVFYDLYGNPTSIIKSSPGGSIETTITAYQNIVSTSQWLLGRPDTTTVQYNQVNDTTISRSVTRVFASTNNNLISEKANSGTDKEIIKSYIYNPNGSLKRQSLASNGNTRVSSYTYEFDSIRIHTTTDPLLHTTTNSYDSYGRLYTTQDFLGNISTYQYDNFGRQSGIVTSDGSQTATTFSWHNPGIEPLLSRYSVETTGNDGSQKISWYDNLGRVVRSDVNGFDGTMIHTSSNYNIRGLVANVSEPYFEGATPAWNSYAYDDFGRQSSLTRPSGRNTTWSYAVNTVTETTAGKPFTKNYAENGTMTSATDNGGTINYTYYPDGKVRTVTAPGGFVSKMYYDIVGNQIKLVDPSAGTIKYIYDGFGQLNSQISPAATGTGSKTTTMSYLGDGRLSQKVTTEGTTKYRYNSNKQLSNSCAPGGISKSTQYDIKGRISAKIDTLPGLLILRTDYTYDDLGRIRSIKNPSGITEYNKYNSFGYLDSISSEGSVRWAINSMNARNQVTSGHYENNLISTFGFDEYGFPSSIVTDTIQNYSYIFNSSSGNMERRQNHKHAGLIENFQYDNLDRLTNIEKDGIDLEMTYDNVGRMSSKFDAGTFNYEDKPYAISSIEPAIDIVPADTEYVQNITYTSFESISSITEKNFQADFTYNSDNERARMIVKQDGNPILTRWYSGSYIKEAEGSNTRVYTFIGGDAYSAPVVAITQNDTTTYYNLLRDNLESITQVVNSETKSLVAEYSFDAWGRMRDPTTWINYEPGSEPPLFVGGRGYTSHEYLPWFKLINMNGRVYDPLIAMFLSPDNNVQAPDLTQNFNRYGYCLNNPLVYTDPSGEIIFTILAAIFCPPLLPIAIGTDIGWISGGIRGANTPGMTFLDGAWRGGITGAVGGALSMVGGGTFVANVAWGMGGGAITGGLDAALWGNDIGKGMLNGAAIGGAFAAVQSGYQVVHNGLEYGYWNTDVSAFDKMVEGANYTLNGTTMVNQTRAQGALNFWQDRFGGPALTYSEEHMGWAANGTPFHDYQSPSAALNGKISIPSEKFILGSDVVKRSIAHETGHYYFNIPWSNKPGGSINGKNFINLDLSKYGGDGIFGYGNAIRNAGLYHINFDVIAHAADTKYGAQAWRDYNFFKWLFLIPRRF